MGHTWVLSAPRWAPCWPHEPCYQGSHEIRTLPSPCCALLWLRSKSVYQSIWPIPFPASLWYQFPTQTIVVFMFSTKNTVSCDIFSIMARSTYVCSLPIPCGAEIYQWIRLSDRSGGRFKNAYELLNLRALKNSMLCKNHIFQRMGKIFCVEFQRVPLKFHTKYLTHTLKEVDFIHRRKLKSS